ncbi:MAG: hypothetical protein ACI9A7_000320, partial [Cyclobacteriaceae bacterium]
SFDKRIAFGKAFSLSMRTSHCVFKVSHTNK